MEIKTDETTEEYTQRRLDDPRYLPHLPRYLRRAIFSNREKDLTAAVKRALNEGWTKEQLKTQYQSLISKRS